MGDSCRVATKCCPLSLRAEEWGQLRWWPTTLPLLLPSPLLPSPVLPSPVLPKLQTQIPRPIPTSPIPFIPVETPFTTKPAADIPFTTTPADSTNPKQQQKQQNKPPLTKPKRSSAFIVAALRKKKLADDLLNVTPGAGRRVQAKPAQQVPSFLSCFFCIFSDDFASKQTHIFNLLRCWTWRQCICRRGEQTPILSIPVAADFLFVSTRK
jgi:hypothetical protein